MQPLDMLRNILNNVPKQLLGMDPQAVAKSPQPGKWSAKQELGHLIDSAANNHQRIVRAQVENQPALAGYEGDRWVELHNYQDRDWTELVGLWAVLNQQFLVAAQRAMATGPERTCTIGGSGPLTVSFIIQDYVEHMRHHLEHIGVIDK